jgi:CheY-like chemotaxis protein
VATYHHDGHIIYIEDEPNDVFFMERAFRQCAPDVELTIFPDAQEAIRYFTDDFELEQGRDLKPRLVLLDIKLPGRSGLDVLETIRSNSGVGSLPVIMYTSSNLPKDVAEAYRLGCSAYLVKARSTEKLQEVVNAVSEFWIRENQYPPAPDQVNQ